MIDLITKENSFYALYNEPFGDILKAYFIQSPAPALVGMVADAPAPVDKGVTQIAKNVVQFAVQRIEISGVKGNPKEIVAEILNEIDRQLKLKQLSNGILCCSVIVVYENNLYIGGVGDCSIVLCNERGALRFCHDGPNEPRPEGVENITIAPAELAGLSHEARLGDLPKLYDAESVYRFETDPSLNIYMFSDGLTKHIPDFFPDLVNMKPDDVFERVNKDIPQDTDLLQDDICFSVIKMPAELAPKPVVYPAKSTPFTKSPKNGAAKPPKSKKSAKAKRAEAVTKEKEPDGAGFWVLFIMLLFIMVLIVMFGFWAVYEWLNFKKQFFEIIK